jgi:DNA primase
VNFEEIKERIKERADLAAIIGRHTKPTKTARGFKACCPLPGHKEKTPSFHYDQQKNYFYCYGCNRGGDVFKFLELVEGIPFFEALKDLAEGLGIKLPKSQGAGQLTSGAESSGSVQKSVRDRGYVLMDRVAKFYSKILNEGLSPGAILCQEYLEKRGMSLEKIEKYRLGWSLEKNNALVSKLGQNQETEIGEKLGIIRNGNNGSYDFFRGRLMIPIMDVRARVIGFSGRTLGAVTSTNPKYINSSESEWFKKKAVLYGIERVQAQIRSEQFVTLVEGFFDQWAMEAAGIPSVAVMGTALTPDHLAVLGRFTKNVILLLDADEAGVNSTRKSMPLLLQSGWNVRVFSNFGGKDPDEWLQGKDAKQIEAIKDQLRLAPEGLEWLARVSLDDSLKSKSNRQQILESLTDIWVLATTEGQKERILDILEPVLGFERNAISKSFENVLYLKPRPRSSGDSQKSSFSAEEFSIPHVTRPLEKSLKDRITEDCFTWWMWHLEYIFPISEEEWLEFKDLFQGTFIEPAVLSVLEGRPKSPEELRQKLDSGFLSEGSTRTEETLVSQTLFRAFVQPEKGLARDKAQALSTFKEYKKMLMREKFRAEIALLRNQSRNLASQPEELNELLRRVQILSQKLDAPI